MKLIQIKKKYFESPRLLVAKSPSNSIINNLVSRSLSVLLT